MSDRDAARPGEDLEAAAAELAAELVARSRMRFVETDQAPRLRWGPDGSVAVEIGSQRVGVLGSVLVAERAAAIADAWDATA
jgi:hypothetical protein